ncbi:MAG: xanthine dehydrogenase family protein molybdopterin-binding subunit [Deltaproteobacteria bacterium]|nr:xanthine dehydrogenase family protein molybdopterin-binding subunit [Deltaproteobacteria bacterium]MBI3078085.1 xanthine dehydrogenase family protein molybdopterin-binding subunit [Deltaproteobacteria bacterium]
METKGNGFSAIGKGLPMVDARDKVTGLHDFGMDVALPGMLWGRVLRSPHPHARITHIDTSRAARLPGVVAIVTGDDAPRRKFSVCGQRLEDEHLLAIEKARYVGDEVAAVAAFDEDTAEEACTLIDVEYELLPAVLDPFEAMQPGAPLVHEHLGTNVATHTEFVRGDLGEALRQADAVVKERFSLPYFHQAYLEMNSCAAEWDSEGRLTLYASTQSPALSRGSYARALDIPPERIRVVQCHMGGAFGAKLEYKLHPICALLARKAGRPVKMVNPRHEEFFAGLPRVPMTIDLMFAAKKDGTILGKEIRIVADNGAYINYAHAAMLSALLRHDNLYRYQHTRAVGDLVYTNKVTSGCFRGFGNLQGHWAVESLMDILAEELGMDPAELRKINGVRTGDTTIHGWKILSCGLQECIDQVTKAAGWEQKRYAPKPRGPRKRGVGLACCLHVSGNRSFVPMFDGASAICLINAEGQVRILTGETDMGAGTRTAMSQMAAEALGVPVEWVQISTGDTDVTPHGLGTYADRGTTLGGGGVMMAALDAKRQVLELAAEELEARAEDLVIDDGVISVRGNRDRGIPFRQVTQKAFIRKAGGMIVGTGTYIPNGVSDIDPKTKYGNISCAYPFAAQVAEVEVDEETGEVWLVNHFAAHDLGRTINPLAARGQIIGAVAQGVGHALLEQMVYDDKGMLRNPSFKRYLIPRAWDMPRALTTILVETNDPNGPFGAKGLAEPALIPTPPAIANAIYNAVGVRLTHLPLTPEKVLRALKEKRERTARPEAPR